MRATHGNGVRAEAERPGLPLRANFAWTLTGNGVYAGCQWAMLAAVAKLGSPEMVGRFALGLAVVAPVLVLSMLHLRAVLATDTRSEFAFREYLGLRLATTAAALAAIAAIAAAAGYPAETAWIIVAAGAAGAVDAVGDIVYGLLQQRERMDRVARSLMIKGPLSLLALVAVMHLRGSVLWCLAAVAAARLLVLAGHDLPGAARLCARRVRATRRPQPMASHSAHPPPWTRLLRLLAVALPLGLVMTLLSLQTNIPRYFIERYLGEGDLGVFAAVAHLTAVGAQVTLALGPSASPRLARYYAAGDGAAFRRLLLRLAGVGAALGAAGVTVAWLAGPQILALLYRPEYAAHAGLLVLLMLGAALSYVGGFLGAGITATRGFARLPLPYLLLTGLVAACSAAWIPRHGLDGAAWTAIVLGAGSCLVPLALLLVQPPRTA